MMTRTFTLTLVAAGLAVSQLAPPPPEPPEPPLLPEAALAQMEAARADMAGKAAFLESRQAMLAAAHMAHSLAPPKPPLPPVPVLAGRSRLSEDEQLKATAMETLMRNDPDRAIAAIEKLMANPATSPALRESALSVLSRSDSPKAQEIVVRTAKSSSNTDLQRRAVHYLGMQKNNDALAEIYSAATDPKVKREVLQAYLISGNREAVVKAARSESNAELRKHAIQLLGAMRGSTELSQLYAAESDAAVRGAILNGLAVSGDVKSLIGVARQEKSPELRRRAVQHLALMNSKEAADFLSELLEK